VALRVDKNIVELSTDLHRQPTVAEIAHATAATEVGSGRSEPRAVRRDRSSGCPFAPEQ
jgi:hypothetical protein